MAARPRRFCFVAQAALSMTLPFTARSSTNATDARELMNAGLSRQEATCLLVAKGAHLGAVRGELRPVALLSGGWRSWRLLDSG
jgi:hypothetical protein